MYTAYLKIDRAVKHIIELNDLFKKHRPFSYCLETNTKTGKRATYAKRVEPVTNEAAIIIGDVVHNIRASIDHAYWEVTNAFAKSEGEKNKIQFPITSTKESFEKSVIPGLPSRVSESFAKTLLSLKPYREDGGNKDLCAIHDLDIIDKHKLLIPTGNYTRITSEIIQRQVPDFPSGITNFGASNCHRDVVWSIPSMNRKQRRARKFPKSGILEQELSVPVDIVFSVRETIDSKPVIPTLHHFIDVARQTVEALYTHKNHPTSGCTGLLRQGWFAKKSLHNCL
ncbi:MAG: hypothetical protein R6V08_02560 [Desulfuromonadales bacterium]